MITMNWATKVLFVPKNYTHLTLSGTDPATGREIYNLDTEKFREDLLALEASEDAIAFPKIHKHETVTILSGTPFARKIIIVNGYQIEFEDGQYAVSLQGSNNNISEVSVVNQVSVRPNNSVGATDSSSTGGFSEEDKNEIKREIKKWNMITWR